MEWDEEELQERLSGISQEDAETIKKLIAAQKKQGNMLPLPNLPGFCKCSSVKCNFQDPSFLANSVEQLEEKCKEKQLEIKHMKSSYSEVEDEHQMQMK